MKITFEQVKSLKPCPAWTDERLKSAIPPEGIEITLDRLLTLTPSNARWLVANLLWHSGCVVWAEACAARTREYADNQKMLTSASWAAKEAEMVKAAKSEKAYHENQISWAIRAEKSAKVYAKSATYADEINAAFPGVAAFEADPSYASGAAFSTWAAAYASKTCYEAAVEASWAEHRAAMQHAIELLNTQSSTQHQQ